MSQCQIHIKINLLIFLTDIMLSIICSRRWNFSKIISKRIMKLLNLSYKTSILKKWSLSRRFNHRKKEFRSNRKKGKNSITIIIRIIIRNIKSTNKLSIKKSNTKNKNNKNSTEIRLKESENVNKKYMLTLHL